MNRVRRARVARILGGFFVISGFSFVKNITTPEGASSDTYDEFNDEVCVTNSDTNPVDLLS